MPQNEIVLLACYELGHQPLTLAWPLAVLQEAGHNVLAVDLSRQDFPTEAIKQAKLVAISVPMHTALRLGEEAALNVRQTNPDIHINMYGLYAHLNREYLIKNHLAHSIISGEPEAPLAALADAIMAGRSHLGIPGVAAFEYNQPPYLERPQLPIPQRIGLPDIEAYAHYIENGTQQAAGYTETSRGCLHTCRHCPIVPVYNGRFFIIPQDTVLADIRQQVMAGARHITFGDPDFLNGPKHSLQIAQALHAEFPGVTFDFTCKVEHILEHTELFPQFSELGCMFVVTAFEAASNHTLELLDKGHTVADMEVSLLILRNAGIAPQPTWMPFTPWTSLQDYADLLAWIRAQELIPHVPIVQLAVRMLVPPGSKLVELPGSEQWCGSVIPHQFSHQWHHPDQRMEELHQTVSKLAEDWGDADPYWAFHQVEKAAYALLGQAAPASQTVSYSPQPPRLTEHWFC